MVGKKNREERWYRWMTKTTVSLYACQDLSSKTQDEVNLTVIKMGNREDQNKSFPRLLWEMAACAFLNAEHHLQSLCWVWYPDINGCRHAASCPCATWDGAGQLLSPLPFWLDIAAHAVSTQPKQGIRPPKAGIRPWKQLSFDSDQPYKGLVFTKGAIS